MFEGIINLITGDPLFIFILALAGFGLAEMVIAVIGICWCTALVLEKKYEDLRDWLGHY